MEYVHHTIIARRKKARTHPPPLLAIPLRVIQIIVHLSNRVSESRPRSLDGTLRILSSTFSRRVDLPGILSRSIDRGKLANSLLKN